MSTVTNVVNKINKLPPGVQREVLDFVDFLSRKYRPASPSVVTHKKKLRNPLMDVCGFAEIGPLTSRKIDEDVYGA